MFRNVSGRRHSLERDKKKIQTTHIFKNKNRKSYIHEKMRKKIPTFTHQHTYTKILFVEMTIFYIEIFGKKLLILNVFLCTSETSDDTRYDKSTFRFTISLQKLSLFRALKNSVSN